MKSRPFRTRSGRNLRLASLEQLEDRRLLATFTVTSTGDSGPGTLRQAIVDSNVQAGPNTIDFNIPGTGVQTIAPISALPAITTPVTIDGYSQPGAHPNTNGPRQGDNATLLIQLDGSNLALSLGSPTGLLVTGGGSTVRGLVIDDFYQGIDLQSDGNTVFGNFIGTTPDGSAVAKGSANRYQPYGIELEGANNQIGGSDPADRNVISGNSTAIWVPNNPARAATGNLAEGNLIGLDATGTKGIYGSDGFDIESGSGMTIGGTASGAGNVISGIDGRAIYILLVGPDSAAHQQNGNGGCLIEGNFIGTDVTGTALVHTTNPNTNQQFQGNRIGILIDYAGYLEPQSPIPSTIGGTAAGAGNVISGNSGVAMSINPDTVGTLVEGNFVGTDLTGTENLGNLDLGLNLNSPASTIGGTAAGAANVFAYNHSTSGDAAGVVFGRNASGSSFLGNSVFGNGTEGFITESTAAPAPPVIASVTATSDGKTLIQGTLKDAVNTSFRLEFFSNAVADPSGVGQGQTFLGAAEVTTDATGAASFSATVAAIPAGQGFVVATATDAANNTSGYSKEYVHTQVNPAPTMTKLVVPSSPVIVGQPVTLVAIVSATAGGVPPGSVIFTIDGVAQSPVPLTVSDGQDQATLPETALTIGTHHVTAAYGGNSAFQPSMSPEEDFQIVSVSATPTTTQLVVPSSPVPAGQTVTLQAIVRATSEVEPPGSVVFTIDGVAQSPVPLVVSNGQDQATLPETSLAAGTHLVTAAYGGNGSFQPSASPQRSILVVAVHVPGGDGPRITAVERFGVHMMPTTLRLQFNEALDPASAQDVNNYQITGPAGRRISVRSATYDSASLTVTLQPSQRINIHHPYKFVIDGTGPVGLCDTSHRLLDGANTGQPGSDYQTSLTWRNLVLPSAINPRKLKPASSKEGMARKLSTLTG